MSEIKAPETWGEWVERRAIHLGFRGYASLAASIGCSTDQLTRWMRANRPPIQMRKRFDERLAASLRIDAHTLFIGWPHLPPESLPAIENSAPRLASGGGDELKQKVYAMVELLDPEGLRELHGCGRELLRKEMTSSAA